MLNFNRSGFNLKSNALYTLFLGGALGIVLSSLSVFAAEPMSPGTSEAPGTLSQSLAPQFQAQQTQLTPAQSIAAPAGTAQSAGKISATASTPDTPQAREVAAKAYLKIQPVEKLYQDTVKELAVQVPAEKREEFLKVMSDAVDMPKLEDLALQSLTKNFTATELNSMAQFYGSSTGQAIYQKFPSYLSDIGAGLKQVIHMPEQASPSAVAPATGKSATAPAAKKPVTPSRKSH